MNISTVTHARRIYCNSQHRNNWKTDFAVDFTFAILSSKGNGCLLRSMLYRSLRDYISVRFRINEMGWRGRGEGREGEKRVGLQWIVTAGIPIPVKESSKPRYKQQRNRYIGLFKFSCGVPRHWKILNIPACKYWKFWNTRKTQSFGYGTSSYARQCYVPIIISVRNRLRKRNVSYATRSFATSFLQRTSYACIFVRVGNEWSWRKGYRSNVLKNFESMRHADREK